jgi:hypothetical protein
MNPHAQTPHEFLSVCDGLLARFFGEFPDSTFQTVASRVLEKLVAQDRCPEGKPGGWAGGIVHAIAKYGGLGQHTVLNSEMQTIFGVSIGTIHKRAEQIWPAVRSEVEGLLSKEHGREEFTLRDEANAVCAFAFRNGFIEDIHASVDSDGHPRITDSEMKRLMIEASRKLARLLEMKATDPEGYFTLLKVFGEDYCRDWER